MAIPGTGSTNQSLTFAAAKKLLGKAHTSNLKEVYNETIPSNIQLNTSTIFGEAIPTVVSRNQLYGQFSASLGAPATVEFVEFYVQSIAGTSYDANDGTFGDVGFAGGDEAQSAGAHGYELVLTSSYESTSSNSAAGTGFFVNNQVVHQSNGKLQLINPQFGPQSNNKYDLEIFTGHPEDGGLKIPTTSPIDYLVDYFNGTIFVQDFKNSAVPKYARGYIYIGKFANTAITEAGAGGGLDVISGSAATYHRFSGSTGTMNLLDADRIEAGQVTATTFSGSLTTLSDGSDYLIAGSNITLSTSSAGAITISSTGGGGGADFTTISGSSATYHNVSSSAITVNFVDADRVTTGQVIANKLSGSLTTLSDGSDYLIAGSNITLSTSSAGAITISSTGGGAVDLDSISGSLATYHRMSGSTGTFNLMDTDRLEVRDITSTGKVTMTGLSNGVGVEGKFLALDVNNNIVLTSSAVSEGILLTNYNANIQFQEAPDGSRTEFTINDTFTPGTQMVFRNGLLMATGSGFDYVVSGNSGVIFNSEDPPEADENIRISYAQLRDYFTNNTLNESPNGTRTQFTTNQAFLIGSQMVFRDGVYMTPGATNDYTVINNTTIEFAEAPDASENIRITFITSS